MALRRYSAPCLAAALLCLSGCGVTQWMVNLRTSQGDTALERSSLIEAEKEYELALKLDPHNAHARSGLARVLFLQARADFINSKLDEAAVAIARAERYAPDDATTRALAGQIDQAKLRREVVLANYPLYEPVGVSLADSLKTLAVTQEDMATQIKAFRSDFDTAHLTRAIIASYDLEDATHRVTQRLIRYRALVATGAPKARAPSASEIPNLLPVP